MPNEDLTSFAEHYPGHEAALEAGSNCLTIYETLSKHLDV